MKREQIWILIVAAFVLLLGVRAESAISLRAGMASPLGEFKDLAKTGWSAGVLAEVRPLTVNALMVVVEFSTSHFARCQYDFPAEGGTHTQKSQMTLLGGGLGLRLMPPTPVLKPFAELLGRVSSVEQDFRDNDDKASVESKTVIGYEINGGLRYGISPEVDLELGGGYTAFSKAKFKHKDTVMEVAPRGWQAFVGVALTIGL